jgi:hypothetical protein
MTREQKIEKKKARSILRASKNGVRNKHRKRGTGNDCPYYVDMYGQYGTCDCGGKNYDSCLGDI